MVSRAFSVVVLATCAFAINGAAALAQGKGTDPGKIGDNIKDDIVSPNAKAFWWIILICGLIGMAASRKRSQAGGIAVFLILAGIAIYNPGGVGNFMQGISTRVF